ncbi:11106_t:CDS:2 [Entrophospora sp. SA101]|nr:11106_t:CDS:2 [Entrophospora sp. SA101]
MVLLTIYGLGIVINRIKKGKSSVKGLGIKKTRIKLITMLLVLIIDTRKASDLPADSDISAAKYDELKVPGNKKYDPVKIILRDKKTQLRSAKVQPDLTEIATELNQKPIIRLLLETNQAKKKIISQVITSKSDIIVSFDEEYLDPVISQKKTYDFRS